MRIGRTSSLAIAYTKLDESNNGDTVRFKDPSASLSLEMENKEGLDGKTHPEMKKVGDGSIIVTFDKTPNPQNSKDVVCPHFIELKWANGCNFDCAWCYLNGTLRFRPMLKKPYLKSPAKISSHLQAFLAQWQRPSLLNTGELSDSLVFEGNGFSLTNKVIPLFKGQKKHKLLILTKSANIRSLLKSESQDCVITSFSLNSSSVARRWERKAPPPEKRIEAAKKLYNNGYEVRIRIDPMVPIRNWKRDYRELVEMIVTNLT
ncbi:MAG: radical SAM protein, partial [Thermoplasmata archaeon]